jgi:hypothetical protein
MRDFKDRIMAGKVGDIIQNKLLDDTINLDFSIN